MLHYVLVFFASMLVDIVPVPLPPAFTVMIFFQIKYDLNIWLVLLFGVSGSVLGRFLLSMYVPYVTDKLFKKKKNEDVQFLGKRMKEKGVRGQLFILLYSLLPLPTTPLFIASGMARLKPLFIIIPFLIGKFTSDLVVVVLGKYATENTQSILQGLITWKSVTGLALGLILIFILIFIDWKMLLLNKRFVLRFNVFKKKKRKKK